MQLNICVTNSIRCAHRDCNA